MQHSMFTGSNTELVEVAQVKPARTVQGTNEDYVFYEVVVKSDSGFINNITLSKDEHSKLKTGMKVWLTRNEVNGKVFYNVSL